MGEAAPFVRMVAFRYLRARREEGIVSLIAFLSLLSIMLGVAALIIVMSVLNGFRAELRGRVFGLSGQLSLESADGGPLRDYQALAAKLKNAPGIVRLVPVVEGEAMLSAGGQSRGAKVRGVTLRELRTRPIIVRSIRSGNLGDLAGGDGVLIGDRMAGRLGLVPGDFIQLASPRSGDGDIATLPRIQKYRVAATFHMQMGRYDNGYVLMPISAAQAQFEMADGVSKLEVFLHDPDRADAVQRDIGRRFGGTVKVVHWRKLNAALFTALEVERAATFIIVALIILVAAFNIVSGLTMLVKDKGPDIAILRTVGASSRMIMRIFMLAGGAIGGIGTILGFILGISVAGNMEALGQWLASQENASRFASEISFLANMPTRIEPAEVAGVVLLSLALSFGATIYPAWRAARLDPVEALRNG